MFVNRGMQLCVSVDVVVVVVVVVRPAPASCCCSKNTPHALRARFAGHLELTDWRSSRVDLLICEPAPLYLDPKSHGAWYRRALLLPL